MGNKTTTQIVIKTNQTCYYPGETVKASVFISAPNPVPCAKIVLHIEGYEESQFRLDVGNKEVQNSHNTLIRTFFVLKDFHSSKSYLHGQYQYPCQYTLPWVLPGSFNDQKGSYKAKIYYYMKVILVSPKNNKENFEFLQEIVVRQRQKQLDQYQMGKVSIHPKCLCFSKLGVSNIKCWFQSNLFLLFFIEKNYLPNDNCIIICQIDNTKCKRDINHVKCEFIKTLTLRSRNGVYKVIKEILNTSEFKGVNKGSGTIGPMADKATLPLRYKNTAIGIHPSTTGNLVKCQYSVNITPSIGGCFTKGEKSFSVNLQILPLQLVQNIIKPSVWQPQVNQMSSIQLVQKNENEMRQSIAEDYAAD